jgi:hypothetical protein
MVVRFLALFIAVSMMGAGLTACHGGGGTGCDDSDGTPCAPAAPPIPPPCSFPTSTAPTVTSPGFDTTVAAATFSQIVITDSDPAPYRRQPWMLVVSTDSNPFDFVDNTSPYILSSTLTQQGSTASEIAILPKNALAPGAQYFIFIVTTACTAAGPIGEFFTS